MFLEAQNRRKTAHFIASCGKAFRDFDMFKDRQPAVRAVLVASCYIGAHLPL